MRHRFQRHSVDQKADFTFAEDRCRQLRRPSGKRGSKNEVHIYSKVSVFVGCVSWTLRSFT